MSPFFLLLHVSLCFQEALIRRDNHQQGFRFVSWSLPFRDKCMQCHYLVMLCSSDCSRCPLPVASDRAAASYWQSADPSAGARSALPQPSFHTQPCDSTKAFRELLSCCDMRWSLGAHFKPTSQDLNTTKLESDPTEIVPSWLQYCVGSHCKRLPVILYLYQALFIVLPVPLPSCLLQVEIMPV